MKPSTLARLIVAGALMVTTSACDTVSASDFVVCMDAAQGAIRDKIDAGNDSEQIYQDAMNECGFEQLSDAERDKLFSGS